MPSKMLCGEKFYSQIMYPLLENICILCVLLPSIPLVLANFSFYALDPIAFYLLRHSTLSCSPFLSQSPSTPHLDLLSHDHAPHPLSRYCSIYPPHFSVSISLLFVKKKTESTYIYTYIGFCPLFLAQRS